MLKTHVNTMRGFSLIEMMVAIVVGMIVMAGAIGLIVAISTSNSQTIQATRAHQELRALASVIADESKRSRRLHDGIRYVGTGATTNGTFDFVDASAGNCILYGYQDKTKYATSDDTSAATNSYRAISLQTTAGVGSVVLASANAAVTCTTAGTTLNSSQINVTSLQVSCGSSTTGLTATQVKETCSEIDLVLQGKLKSEVGFATPPTYTYRQSIFIRSGAVKTS